jgi:ribosomal protein S18 acetylase RimI-like enzyme
MKKRKLMNKVSLFFVGVFLFSASIKASNIINFGAIDYVESGNLENEKKVFKMAFTECYKDIPLHDLGIGQPTSRHKTLDQFLQAAFEDEERDLAGKKSNTYFLHATTEQGQIIGYASFDVEEKEDGKQAYIRHLAVDPSFERQGIGARLVYFILDENPSLTRIYLVTRRVNNKAILFYQKLSFKKSNDIHGDLDPTRYVGYEKVFSPL